jgi:hypothetical protein
VSDWTIFNARLYVLADGLVYQEVGDSWQDITIDGAGRFIDKAYQYPIVSGCWKRMEVSGGSASQLELGKKNTACPYRVMELRWPSQKLY